MGLQLAFFCLEAGFRKIFLLLSDPNSSSAAQFVPTPQNLRTAYFKALVYDQSAVIAHALMLRDFT